MHYDYDYGYDNDKKQDTNSVLKWPLLSSDMKLSEFWLDCFLVKPEEKYNSRGLFGR